jgi:muramoyltetrapeptide carboxypeptidase
MLNQLPNSQSLRDVSGIIFGAMSGCEAKATMALLSRKVLLDALKGFEGPIAIGLAAGHCAAPMLTLPLGTRVLRRPKSLRPEGPPPNLSADFT